MLETIGNRGFVVKVATDMPEGRYKHKFGGLPQGVEKWAVPKCVNCQHPLHLFFQIDLRDPRFGRPDSPLRYIYIFNCLNCDSYREPLFYRIDAEGAGIKILAQAAADHFGAFPPVLPEDGIVFEAIVRRRLHEQQRKHQFGGRPFRVRDAVRPNCVVCGKPMPFVAQVDSDDTLGIMFGDMGLLYAFFCEGCRVFATFMHCR
jgi:hypothetical protein